MSENRAFDPKRPWLGWHPAVPLRPKRPFWRRKERFTREQIEAHLASDLRYWLPAGGEAGDTEAERDQVAKAAAEIIVGRLNA